MTKIFDKLSLHAQQTYNLVSAKKIDIICGTGHRPKDLDLEYSEESEKVLRNFARQELQKLNLSNYQIIMSGMALGWDMALAEAALLENHKLWAAIPILDFSAKWHSRHKSLYEHILNQADKIIYVCDGYYSPEKFQHRNIFMSECSNSILALWSGKTHGGTYNCIKYAESRNKKVINIYDNWLEYKRKASGVN